MGRLAKQKNALRREKKPMGSTSTEGNREVPHYKLSPPTFAMIARAEIEREEEPVDQWSGLTMLELSYTIQASFPRMLLNRLLLDYADFLTPSFQNVPPPDDRVADLDWAELLARASREQDRYKRWCSTFLFGPDGPGPVRPFWRAISGAASQLPSGSLDMESVVTEIERFIRRRAGKLPEETELPTEFRWRYIAERIMNDVRLVEFIFAGQRQTDLLCAIRRFQGAYLEDLWAISSVELLYTVTERGRELEKSW
ncbi:hypothetical protein BJ508DRAFT_364854 [Ascobolus immersus RN42]|uniref:Uncharacterized protein n=1 Tax=Ascobolus immersus RN42 TaxID=1160509 RepID=A0A3N4HUQ2_ASCIM|nr:hypothetical protein BJ508DRAFT_364854 [Ascobolus immersus RN42]